MKTALGVASLFAFGCSSAHKPNDNQQTPDAPVTNQVDAGMPDAPDQTGGSGLYLKTVADGVAYFANVTLGGDQHFWLDVDTGSTTLGVASATCTTCNVTPGYTPGPGAVDQHNTAMATYGDMSGWTGENYMDTVKLTGDGGSVSMRLSAITSQNGFFRPEIPFQGIIGFLDEWGALPNTDGYMPKRKAGGLSNYFAFQFCQDKGRLWMDSYDPASMAGPVKWTAMPAPWFLQPFYTVKVSSAKVGTASIGLSGAAVADTGTTLMIVPKAVETSLITAVTGSAGYKAIFGTQVLDEMNCPTPGTHTRAEIDAMLPPFTVTLPDKAGGSFTLTSPATQSYLFYQAGMNGMPGGYCLGVAAVANVPTILGDSFMRQFITVFDLANGQIGFAPQQGCTFADNPVAQDPLNRAPVEPHWYLQGHPQR
jgi:hypothetical protein